MAVMAQHLQRTAPRLDKVNPAISPALAALVAYCLTREPDDRYPNMPAFINAMDHPEDVDLAILEKLDLPPNRPPLWQSQTFKGIVIALAIMAGFIILALILQTLRK